MKIIECLNDKISEELSDSESYANLALKYKESDKETAKLFYDLSLEETKLATITSSIKCSTLK